MDEVKGQRQPRTLSKPADRELAHWARLIEELRWAGFLLDPDYRLAWMSSEIERFLGSPPEEELGCGLHVIEAFTREPWRRIATPESRIRFWQDLAPFVVGGIDGLNDESISESLRALLEKTDPRPLTRPVSTSIDYVEPGSENDLPVSRVDILVTPLFDAQGDPIGVLGLCYMGVRPGLVSLLARGDEAMYERMAMLVEPRSHQAAVLFCDLHGSTELARTLPTSEYFRLIRHLWTEIDALVAREKGIIGKHAGDGASAFFLEDHLGSESNAAQAAARTARGIHERSEEIFGELLDSSCLMRIGIHWGNSLYIGQLVPGGRLDITALGDPVNECARIQECAEPHQTLASKTLIEQLSPNDAAALGLDPEKVRYRLLSDFPSATDKTRAVAGAISVAPLWTEWSRSGLAEAANP
jgi:class 3 adenylate cyclase/PAS domain-containing protein